MKTRQIVGTPRTRPYAPYTSRKNMKRALGGGGKQTASAGAHIDLSKGYAGSGLLSAMLNIAQGDR
jgi:hypothetical protein